MMPRKQADAVESVKAKPGVPREFAHHDTDARLVNLKTSKKVEPFTRA